MIRNRSDDIRASVRRKFTIGVDLRGVALGVLLTLSAQGLGYLGYQIYTRELPITAQQKSLLDGLVCKASRVRVKTYDDVWHEVNLAYGVDERTGIRRRQFQEIRNHLARMAELP